MSERLTASLEDGTLDKLRTLAGGERKVGAYLSDVAQWLWYHREQLETRPLSDFAPVLQEWIPRVVMSPEEQAQQAEESARLNAEIGEWRQRLDELSTEMQQLRIMVEDTARVRDAAAGQQPE